MFRASLAILEFWLKGGRGLKDFGDKGGSQMVDHKKIQGGRYCSYLIMFCMEFILHKILKYKLNNLHMY